MVELRLDRALLRRVDPSDIVQETLVEAHRRFAGYLESPGLPFHLWLRRIALDRLLDAHRRHRRSRKRSLDREEPLRVPAFSDRSSLDLAAELSAPGPTPAAEAMQKELERRFEEVLGRLSPEDREVILLRHFEGFSNQDAARELGLTPPAAGMRYLRALRRLRALLGGGPPS